MTLTIELWHVPDCPLIDRVRTTLQECLQAADLDVPVHERQGAYPSPTLVVNGIDVVTGTAPADGLRCRLDLPTHSQIQTALARSSQSRMRASGPDELRGLSFGQGGDPGRRRSDPLTGGLVLRAHAERRTESCAVEH